MKTRSLASRLLAGAVLTVAISLHFGFGANAAQNSMTGFWLVTIDGEADTRSLIVAEEAATSGGALLMAKYGISNKGTGPVVAKIIQESGQRQLDLITQASARIVAVERSDGNFVGTFTFKNGVVKNVLITRSTQEHLNSLLTQAQPPSKPSSLIEPPGVDVPSNCAAFSGGFGGDWPIFGRLNLWVVRINADCTAQVVWGAAPRPSASSKLMPATIKANTLTLPRPDGGSTTFELSGDSVKAQYNGPSGYNGASMTRVSLATAANLAASAAVATTPIPVAPDVPPECAAFHGQWSGSWSQGSFGELYFRVAEVKSAGTTCTIRFSYTTSKSPVPAIETTEVRNGTVAFVCNRSTGGTCVFERKGDVLWGSYTNPGGGSNSGTFKRVQ